MNTFLEVVAAIQSHAPGLNVTALYIRFPHVDKDLGQQCAALAINGDMFTAETMADCVHQFTLKQAA